MKLFYFFENPNVKCVFKDAFKSEKPILNIGCPRGTKSLAYCPWRGSVLSLL